MSQLIRSVPILCAASSIVFAFGCATNPADDDSEGSVEQASNGHTQIHTEDTCNPASFGALCRAGFNGTTTREQFSAELAATKRVATWEYGGGDIRVNAGSTFRVDNVGGEVHTFSVVANYGGGRVPGLNTASGNTVVAPECVAGPNASNVDIASATGINVTTGASGVMKTKGTFKVQCCIHPWMRSTVTIR
jgi:plastocyanin